MAYLDNDGLLYFWQQIKTKFADATHTHTQDQITGLNDALAGKASTSHSHSVASSSASGFMSAADKQKLDGIATGANKYTLPVASSTVLGGMKIGYKESGKNYSVKLDNNNQAYVTVPWTVPDGSVTTKKLADKAVTRAKLANGAVTTDKLADQAVTTAKLETSAVTIDKIDSSAKRELTSGVAYATDATTAQALTAFGFNLTVITPKELYNHPAQPQTDARSRLFWLDTNTGYLDSGVMMLSGSVQTQAITVWAKGHNSTASGILGVDESWTITALPTDADGVSY